MLVSRTSNRHALGWGAACLLMSFLNSDAEVYHNNMIAVPEHSMSKLLVTLYAG